MTRSIDGDELALHASRVGVLRRHWVIVGALVVAAALAGFAYLVARSPATTLEYAKVLAWPLVVAGVLTFVFWRYRNNLAELIDRIHSVRFPGGEIVAPPRQEILTGDQDPFAEDDEEDGFDEIIDSYEQELREHERTADELRRALAVTQGRLMLERIYFHIFGSQINWLRALREAKPAGIARDAAAAFFSTIQAQHRPSFDSWTLDDYMAFLVRHGLVETDGDYRITGLGEAFLDYIGAMTGYGGRPL